MLAKLKYSNNVSYEDIVKLIIRDRHYLDAQGRPAINHDHALLSPLTTANFTVNPDDGVPATDIDAIVKCLATKLIYYCIHLDEISISKRDIEIVQALKDGDTYQSVAIQMGVSTPRVQAAKDEVTRCLSGRLENAKQIGEITYSRTIEQIQDFIHANNLNHIYLIKDNDVIICHGMDRKRLLKSGYTELPRKQNSEAA